MECIRRFLIMSALRINFGETKQTNDRKPFFAMCFCVTQLHKSVCHCMDYICVYDMISVVLRRFYCGISGIL